MGRTQSDSDPLPYVQVDRSVKPRAALLAGALGVTTQHALGSLVEWWDLCGDPRELERIAEATPPGEEPAVVLSSDDAALRFRLASGRDAEPMVLARLGLLEPLEDGTFRVRGMSRYFDPVLSRLRARRAAAVGGRASAETRRAKEGTAQPHGGRGSRQEVRSDVASVAGAAERKQEPKRNGSGDRSGTEAEPKPSGQRSAVSGQRQVEALAPASRAPRETDALCADFEQAVGAKYAWQGVKDGAAFSKLRKEYSLEEIRARWRVGLRGSGWLQVRTVAQLAAKWNDLADADRARPLNTRSPVPAEAVDWTNAEVGEIPL
jgi:hypothetical protein